MMGKFVGSVRYACKRAVGRTHKRHCEAESGDDVARAAPNGGGIEPLRTARLFLFL